MNLIQILQRTLKIAGYAPDTTSNFEKLVSALGGFCGILGVTWISFHFVGNTQAVWVVASMGASAVLLFAVPHGALSQPWPLMAGHILSAVVGVSCAKLIPDPLIAAALAVMLAILVMHYTHSIHPPGGATALTAALGGSSIQELGYQFVLTPVLLNACIILAIAVAFNYLFHWRRYPVALMKKAPQEDDQIDIQGRPENTLTHEDLDSALKAMNLIVDVSPYELEEIYRLAQQHAESSHINPNEIKQGDCYSNGEYGPDWQVRQVIDMPNTDSADDLLIYKVVAGQNRRASETVSRQEFARWARYAVFLNENSWQRMTKRGEPDNSGKIEQNS